LLQGCDKEYTGEITIGATTASYDAELPPENIKPYHHITKEEIGQVATALSGTYDQMPPVYSAIKIDGQPLYKAARRGEDVEIPARKVTIHVFEIMEIALPRIAFRVQCGKGTYIRSLAHDFGQRLGCGAYLSGLRRTQVSDYRIEDALEVETITSREWTVEK
jgi:tRNA pseudouridine55 synthase